MKSALLFILPLLMMLQSCKKATNTVIRQGPASAGFKTRMAYDGNWLYTVDESSLKVFSISNSLTPVLAESKNLDNYIQSVCSAQGLVMAGTANGFSLFQKINEKPLQALNSVGGNGSMSAVIDTPFIYAVQGGNNNDKYSDPGPFPADGIYIFNINGFERFQNYSPLDNATGIAVKDSLVFVCAGTLKVFARRGTREFPSLVLKKAYTLKADDITLTVDNRLIATSSAGIYQLGYTADTVTILSTIPVRAL